MKKFIVLVVSVCILALSGSVFASGVEVGYAVPDTTNPFISWLSTSVKELAAADGIEVQIADAAGNASTQISQVENFIAMKVKVLILTPAGEMEALTAGSAGSAEIDFPVDAPGFVRAEIYRALIPRAAAASGPGLESDLGYLRR